MDVPPGQTHADHGRGDGEGVQAGCQFVRRLAVAVVAIASHLNESAIQKETCESVSRSVARGPGGALTKLM